ncbi:MAG TPA: PKD domain-containing protein, partial [Candidatus Limnocylindria bacterium]|nr:PKD domain-containing protein [Candidatus Limnocylindria bacterium]
MLRIGLSAGLVAVMLSLPAAVSGDPGDIGIQGPSYAGGGINDPTGEKPESKLWFNDGAWWGSLWDTASSRYEIFRFNAATQAWASTNVPLDTRSGSRADTLWDGTKLYVASHVFSEGVSASTSSLYRFSYNASTDVYSLDAGWPQAINNVASEALVIEKDSTGQLWATWVQGPTDGREVWVNRTTAGDSAWGAPFELPGNGTAVAKDDISSIIAFGANKIGVFWSNQKGSSFHFAVHDDSAADDTWSPSVGVMPGSGNADDHINLKSLQTDGSGRVFAVVKTSKKQNPDPSIVLLVRSNSAVWSSHTIWTHGNGLTRPIVLLDTSNNLVHAFAAKESGGPIYTKTSSLSSIGFASGLGTTVMLDASANDINNPTSTKQNVSSATGLLVLASNDSTDHYWHHFNSLGGGPGPTPPLAAFSATPLSGAAPLQVAFSDSSTNAPTSWAWDFDANGSVDSTQQHPTHTYTSPGSYSVSLTATNADGSDVETKVGYITVSQPGGGGGGLTVTPSHDAYVNSDAASTNYGSVNNLRVRDSSKDLQTYLRFT